MQDPNPSVMFKMVKPVSFLQGQVKQFLDEWPEHPGLQRIFDITESLLSMPLNSPLSKVEHNSMVFALTVNGGYLI